MLGFLIWARIVLCINIGGSAGFKIIIAFALSTPVNFFIPSQVVCVYSSILSRVPIPADLEAIWETISMYWVSGWTSMIALAIGVVSCPPQEIILMFFVFRHSSIFKIGIQIFPILEGVI